MEKGAVGCAKTLTVITKRVRKAAVASEHALIAWIAIKC